MNAIGYIFVIQPDLYGIVLLICIKVKGSSLSFKERISFTAVSMVRFAVEQSTAASYFNPVSYTHLAPASLTKLMTVYTALQHIDDLQKTVRIPASIFPQLEKEQASMAGFLPDEEVTYEDLIYGALLPSGADACMTLDISLYGSEDAFVAEMNAQAEKLKLKQTRFQNCTGLDEAGHVSSVRDIAWILDEALKLPKFAEAFHATNYVMAPSNMHPEGMTIYSTMRMTMDQNELSQDDILGGKTGYTKKAGLCLATQARIHEETWLFVSAHASGSATTKPYHILDAINVYEALARLYA